MRPTPVIVVDDLQYIGEIVKRLLQRCEDLRFVTWMSDPDRLGEEIQNERAHGETAPIIVMLDFNIPGHDPIAVMRDTLEHHEHICILIFSGDADCREEVLAAGASECISKDAAPAELIAGLRACAEAAQG